MPGIQVEGVFCHSRFVAGAEGFAGVGIRIVTLVAAGGEVQPQLVPLH